MEQRENCEGVYQARQRPRDGVCDKKHKRQHKVVKVFIFEQAGSQVGRSERRQGPEVKLAQHNGVGEQHRKEREFVVEGGAREERRYRVQHKGDEH